MHKIKIGAKLTLAVVFTLLVGNYAFGQGVSSAVPLATATDTAHTLQLQRAAIGAADSYAAVLTPSRDTASYVVNLKNALKLFNHQAATFVSVRGTPSKIDQDRLYIEHLKDLVSVGNSGTANTANRVWSGLPTNGYFNTVAVKLSNAFCTGVAVSQSAVLTAAHCVCHGPIQEIDVGKYADDDTNVKYKRNVILSAISMRQCGGDSATAADVGLIKLTTTLDPRVKPVTFATQDTIDSLAFVRAVGFGSTQNGSVGQKLYVDIPIASVNCNGSVEPSNGGATESDASWYGCFPTFELVAGAPLLNKDTCHGDSGGPIFYHADDGNGGYQELLVAITSRSVQSPNARDCGDGGIDERVDGPVRDWLVNNQRVNLRIEGAH